MKFMGDISLESYLCNVILATVFSVLLPFNLYVNYSLVIVLGIFGAWLVHKASAFILKKIKAIYNEK